MKLDNIIIGSQKLFVNLPKFQKGIWRTKEKPLQRSTSQKEYQVVGRNKGFTMHDVSYAQATREGEKGRNNERTTPKHKVIPGQHDFAHLTFNVAESTIQKMNKAFVGQVVESGMSYALQEQLNKQGFFGVKATPLGANLVLLEAEDDEAIPNLINDAKDWVGDWLDEIRSWCPREIDNERVVWLRCFGVPVHAWNDNFFSYLVSGIGSFVCVDDITARKECLDVARILVKTKVHDLVSRIVKVEINGDIFSIKMTEEWYEPLQ